MFRDGAMLVEPRNTHPFLKVILAEKVPIFEIFLKI